MSIIAPNFGLGAWSETPPIFLRMHALTSIIDCCLHISIMQLCAFINCGFESQLQTSSPKKRYLSSN